MLGSHSSEYSLAELTRDCAILSCQHSDVGQDRKWGGLLVGRGIFLEEERTFHVGKVFEERAAGMQRRKKEGRNRGGG